MNTLILQVKIRADSLPLLGPLFRGRPKSGYFVPHNGHVNLRSVCQQVCQSGKGKCVLDNLAFGAWKEVLPPCPPTDLLT